MRTTEQELPVEQAVSAGGVVYRFADDGLGVLLCGRIADGLWALPKGTPEDNETLEETAAREVREETGLGVDIVEELGTIAYQFTRPIPLPSRCTATSWHTRAPPGTASASRISMAATSATRCTTTSTPSGVKRRSASRSASATAGGVATVPTR